MCTVERLRPDPAQACRRGEGKAGRDEEEACVQHAQVESERKTEEEHEKSWYAFAVSEDRYDDQYHEHRKGVVGVLRSIHLAARESCWCMRRCLTASLSKSPNFNRLSSYITACSMLQTRNQ